MKRGKAVNPADTDTSTTRYVGREAADAIKMAADKIIEAATLIVNCMTELRTELKALSKRNYREIQMSTNAVKQLVSSITSPISKSIPIQLAYSKAPFFILFRLIALDRVI